MSTAQIPPPSYCLCGHRRIDHKGGRLCTATALCGCTKFETGQRR